MQAGQETLLAEVLSPSQVSQFLNCPAKWMFRYLVDLKERGTVATTLGKAFHGTIRPQFPLGQETVHDLRLTEWYAVDLVLFPTAIPSALERGYNGPSNMTVKELFGTSTFNADAAGQRRQPLELAEAAKVYAEMLQAAFPRPAGAGFALIELLQFTSGSRRSCTITYSALPESSVGEIIVRHYGIISELKGLPGMNWSLMSSDAVQFGDDILFCSLERSSGETGGPSEASRWSEPVVKELRADYAPDTVPSFADATLKCKEYLERIAPVLPKAAAVNVLVVPFSIPVMGAKLGAALILVSGDHVLPPEAVYGLYSKAQLFWLRFNSSIKA